MGRTNPTFRDLLRAYEDRWQAYRRALRQVDQSLFDQLFEYARQHANASGYLNSSEPLFPLLFSVDLEQEHRLDDLEARLSDLEADEPSTSVDAVHD
ncbi:hypothetical protein ACFQPA_19980 [Halomarina halobia]|uniref:DUF8156 domain-containing protein n=1 Tax=Halomarina halobia TaxID=3033386 RepID=A0ABD6AFQ4_9EURY|nr:hypothetical protein [Halomarina sp. PSR21]